MHIPITLLSQLPLRFENHAKTPTILNTGSQPPSDDHLTLAEGKNTGLAGISGGKKKHSIILPYICSLPYIIAFQPRSMLDILSLPIIASMLGTSKNADSARPSTASNTSTKNLESFGFTAPEKSRTKKYITVNTTIPKKKK